MYNKQLIKQIAAIGLCLLPALSFANALAISNNTNEDSTSRIIKDKSRKCTDSMKNDAGITRAHEQNHPIDEANIKIACHPNPENCQAVVYMNDHCGDPAIATVVFSKSQGVLGVSSIPGSGYDINAPIGTFNVIINYASSVAK